MKDITIDKINTVNLLALDAALRADLGTSVLGVSHNGHEVIVHLADDTPPARTKQAQTIVLSHDPAQLTLNQQIEVLNKARLEQSRKDIASTELDVKPFEGKDVLLEQLAKKVAWLEQEINALRTGS